MPHVSPLRRGFDVSRITPADGTLEIYKAAVILTFAKGAMPDPPASSTPASTATSAAPSTFTKGKINETAFKNLIRAAVALNLQGKPKR